MTQALNLANFANFLNTSGQLTGSGWQSGVSVDGSAGSLQTTNFSIVESGGKLYFKYGATNIASLDSSGNFVALANVTASGTP
jgi:hypothetical protein